MVTGLNYACILDEKILVWMNEDDAQEAMGFGFNVFEVEQADVEECFVISAPVWFSPRGKCELRVSHVDLRTTLIAFDEFCGRVVV